MNIAVSELSATSKLRDLNLRVDCIRREANDIVSLELGAGDGRALPAWSPGAHIKLRLASGLIREYSLCGSSQPGAPYRIAVHRVAQSRGGSAEIHNSVRVGGLLRAEGPFNNFALVEAPRYLFIAGGIGITPILPMIGAVDGRSDWRLVYRGRGRSSMAFLSEVARRDSACVSLLPGDEAARPSLSDLIAACAEGTRIYACGPPRMLDELEDICRGLSGVSLHIERFAASEKASAAASQSNDAAFEVVLQRSGHVLTVPPGSTILEEIRKVIPTVPFSCESGYCGTCEARVISGDIDHRDSLLSPTEKEKNKTIMICVSRAASGRLVLDM